MFTNICLLAVFMLLNVNNLKISSAKENDNHSSIDSLEIETSFPISFTVLNALTSSEKYVNPCVSSLVEEFVLLDNGSVLIPGNGNIYNTGEYYMSNSTLLLCSEISDEVSSKGIPLNFSKEFLNCGHILLHPNEFELLDNKSIYVDIYSRVYNPTNYFLQDTGAYVCLPPYSEMEGGDNTTTTELVKFSGALVYVSYIGISISIISLFLHLVVFCLVHSVRNLPGYCLASLSLSLLMAYLCFISSSVHPAKKHCAALGAAIYYFFLASFFWMNILAFDVWRSFRVVMKKLRVSTQRVPLRRFFAYSVYCWLVPAAFVSFAVQADNRDFLPKDFKPSFGYAVCWFGKRKALLVFFACPLFVIMLLNFIFFLDSTCIINRATMKTNRVREAVLRKRFFTFMRLALIMGLTWIVGIVAGYVDQEPVWYMFVILNTLQGLFIFVVFSCSLKVKEFFRKLGRQKRSRQGTSVRTISQISATI